MMMITDDATTTTTTDDLISSSDDNVKEDRIYGVSASDRRQMYLDAIFRIECDRQARREREENDRNLLRRLLNDPGDRSDYTRALCVLFAAHPLWMSGYPPPTPPLDGDTTAV